MDVVSTLQFAEFSSYLSGFSALERFFSRVQGPVLQVETEGSIVDLSRLFDGISFTGSSAFDAVLERGGTTILFRCVDDADGRFGGSSIGAGLGITGANLTGTDDGGASRFQRTLPPPSPRIVLIDEAFTLQGSLLYDIPRRAFVDRRSVYYSLREKKLELSTHEGGETRAVPDVWGLLDGRAGAGGAVRDSWYPVFEAALIVARLGYEPSPELVETLRVPSAGEMSGEEQEERERQAGREPLTELEQRFLLTGVLTGKWAGRGLSLLMETGFLEAHWPLLHAMARVDHSKEHHPEGNVWRHTVEAFAYRKIRELPLSLGLLLHDSGKPFTGPRNGNAFDRHAQIGADRARRFLSQMGFHEELIGQVDYFVRQHMLPAYIPKLPFSRTEEVLSSPLFPELLELYRCDVSSTFRGPDGYYRACATYRNFLKNRRNPFRSSDGKKRLRLLVE